MNVSDVVRKHEIPSLLFRWRKIVSDGGKVAVLADEQVVGSVEVQTLKKRIRDLKRMLGKKTMEVEILQKALEIARKTNYSRALRCPGRMVPADARSQGAGHFVFQTGEAG